MRYDQKLINQRNVVIYGKNNKIPYLQYNVTTIIYLEANI